MTEIMAPLVRDLVAAPPRLPLPRMAPDDRATTTYAPTRERRWHRPVVDTLGAAAAVLAVQMVNPADAAVVLVLIGCWPTLLAGSGCYATQPIPAPLAQRQARVLRAGVVLGLACWVAFPLAGSMADPAILVPLVLAMTLVGLLLRALMPSRARTRVVLVGDPQQARQCLTELAADQAYDIAGVCLPHAASQFDDVAVHVGIADAVDIARLRRADALIILPGAEMSHEVVRRLEWQAASASVAVYIGTALLDVRASRMTPVLGAGLNLLHVRPAVLAGPRRALKDVVERVIAAVGLLALLPALLAVGALIRLGSPGSAVFRQTRVGRGGRTFTMYKFRTMRASAERDRADLVAVNECDDVLFKVRHDPRITQVGAWLRRYSVDELPQLWNVVRGDMSLVGPRPALPSEVDSYDLDPRLDPHRRLEVKPGLTGLWQVSGRSDLTWAESVRLDVGYVDNWTLGQDLSILRRTVGAVLGHRGAY